MFTSEQLAYGTLKHSKSIDFCELLPHQNKTLQRTIYILLVLRYAYQYYFTIDCKKFMINY